ncbi:TPA: hypothetical protein ACGTZJ_003505 [Klebsiella pneumoniae]
MMTSNLTITKGQLAVWVAQLDKDGDCDETDRQLEALIRQTLTAMDSEPVRNPVLAYADSYRDMAKQGVESVPIWSVITDLERNIAPLYRHAQPAPVTQSEPAGWQFKSVNGDWLGLLGESGKDQAVKDGCEVRPLYAAPQLTPLVLTDEQIDAVLDSRGNIEYVISDKRERLRMFAREILRAASPQSADLQTRALVMWIKRLSLALRSASPDNKLPRAVMGYLRDNGLISIADCLRGNNEEPPA